jgi:hypothetical protein
LSARGNAAADNELIEAHFPRLAREAYSVTSPQDDRYNCVAWIGRNRDQWLEPGFDGGTWPREVSDEELDAGDLSEFVRLFEGWGYQSCDDGRLEEGVEKIAVYAAGDDFDHVAYQRPDGTWSSKLGRLNDIRHDDENALAGPGGFEYAPVQLYMSRQREPHEVADSAAGLLLP